MADIILPEAFIQNVLTERGEDGSAWLSQLPDKLHHYCEKWQLKLDDAPPMHGYLGIVFPVHQNNTRCVLKITWVDDETKHEALALSLWNGNGYVSLIESDPAEGVLLLESLDSNCSLNDIPIDEAVVIIGDLLSRHKIQAPEYLQSTSSYANRQLQNLRKRFDDQKRPFAEKYLLAALNAASYVNQNPDNYLVNQDLHYENVLAATREPWLVIDPKPVAGDIEFGIAPLLWNRCSDISGIAISNRLSTIVKSNNLDFSRAREWAILRCTDYWLWSLNVGFDLDPANCHKILDSLLK